MGLLGGFLEKEAFSDSCGEGSGESATGSMAVLDLQMGSGKGKVSFFADEEVPMNPGIDAVPPLQVAGGVESFRQFESRFFMLFGVDDLPVKEGFCFRKIGSDDG